MNKKTAAQTGQKEKATGKSGLNHEIKTATSNYRGTLVSLLVKLQRAEIELHKQFVLDKNPATAGVWIACAHQLRMVAQQVDRGAKEVGQ